MKRGLRQFVVGTGGKGLRGFETTQPNSEARDSETFGILALTLLPKRYGWRFIPAVGSFTDSGSGVMSLTAAASSSPSSYPKLSPACFRIWLQAERRGHE